MFRQHRKESIMDKKNELGLNWKFPKGMKPSGRPLREVFASAREEFYKANGYYATEEDAIRLTEEARAAIRREGEYQEKEAQNET